MTAAPERGGRPKHPGAHAMADPASWRGAPKRRTVHPGLRCDGLASTFGGAAWGSWSSTICDEGCCVTMGTECETWITAFLFSDVRIVGLENTFSWP
jgi:hypothetical protein